MIEPVNIYSENTTIHLSMGTYDVYIIGGWYVKLEKFNFQLKRLNSDEMVQLEKDIWPIQSHYKGTKTRKIASLQIRKGGKYKINFENSETLIVKQSNLFITPYFEQKISPQKIDLLFVKN
ncbi:conserved protein of unknown function [Tenacibaculum sp. 190130A14a]|uniref:Uncharacterized protein n=1 Tax=Tenacibaculum polynesiense TaxID=3137857 RepID=A0ABP1EZE5_9FLAO